MVPLFNDPTREPSTTSPQSVTLNSLESWPRPDYFRGMVLEKMRRFLLVFAAVALFLATLLPGFGVSGSMADSPHTAIAAAMDEMNCPNCDTSQDKMAGCTQATCIGAAVIADANYFEDLAAQPSYAVAAVTWPDGFTSAPPTPPI